MSFEHWLDVTKTINVIQNEYELGGYVGCCWYLHYWDKEKGYRKNLSPSDESFDFKIYISEFKKYLELKDEYIKKYKDVDEVVDYFHQLICTHVDKEFLGDKIVLRYVDTYNTTFLREINKNYIYNWRENN